MSGPLQAPILDETNLQGRYSFTVNIVGTTLEDMPYAIAEGMKQWGLKLDKARRSIEMLVIDRAEKKPTEN